MRNIEKIELFSPCYTGKRFDSHRLPVELVDDLLVLKKMTVEMAKEIYLQKNPDRKRIPKNFTDGISIELEAIEPGSTIPKLVLIFTLTNLFPDSNHECFTKAPARITQIIEAAHSDSDLRNIASDAVLSCFNQFGNNLHDDEQIVFGNKKTSKAIYNKESRKRLQLAASKSKQYTESCELRGKIIALDKDRKSYEIQISNGQKIKGLYQPSDLDVLQEAFVKLEKNQKIWIKGIGVFNVYDKLQNVATIEESCLLDPLDVQSRLEELALLTDGWLDGEQGKSLNNEGLKWLGDTFENSFNTEKLPLPATFPTPEGNIQFEWSFNENEVSLEVHLETKKALFYSLNIKNQAENTEELDLSTNDDWCKLNHKMQVLHG